MFGVAKMVFKDNNILLYNILVFSTPLSTSFPEALEQMS